MTLEELIEDIKALNKVTCDEEMRNRFEYLSHMYDNDANNYEIKADKCHEVGNDEDEIYYRKLAKDMRFKAQICRDFRDMY